MVSPSKKRKDRKGRENDDLKGSVELTLGSRSKQPGVKKSSKSFKPLISKKFYLDIKNNGQLLKIESKLKSLGANIEQFLVKEVNYVVTDRKDAHKANSSASSSTPLLSQSPSPSPSPSPSIGVSSPLDGLGQKKSKSRAEAMLERVRLQPQTVTTAPLENARLWNIPIYSIQEILTRLEKICSKAGSSSKNPPGLKILRGHYVKLETGRRPEFKQLREWPSINLNSVRGETPFAQCHNGSQRVTRKDSKDGTERLAGGYCEMCCVDFPDLKAHVVTPQHLKLANSTDYYAQLDLLINAQNFDTFLSSQMCASVARRCLRSGSVECHSAAMGSRQSSLPQQNGLLTRTRATTRSFDDTCDKRPLEVHCNGIVSNHNHLTRLAVKSDSVLTKEPGLEYEGLSRRTRTISASCPGTNNEFSQLSPTGSDITHHLRSRKQLWLPTSLLGTTAEDAVNNSRFKSSRDYPPSEAMKSPSQAKASLKSPVTPGAEDCKGSGKDEEERTTSKLPHNDFNTVEKGESCDGDEDDDIDTESEKYCPRVREKFEEKKNNSKKKFKKRHITSREVANLSYCDDKRRRVLKKRLSVEEKLIEDNKTYYKVEVLNSKLRSTGYYISQSQRELEMSRANGNDGCVIQNCSEPSRNEIKSEGKEPVVVRFKKVRQTQLSILSDEAESFMFGEPSKRESSVSTESSEDDDEVSLKLESEERGRIVTRIKREVLDDSSIGSSSLASSSTYSRRKRKSPDYIISRENADFFKSEGPSSRLRFHSNLFPTGSDPKDGIKLESPYGLRSERNSLKVTLNENDFDSESADDDKPLSECKLSLQHSYQDLEFSFERAPTHEPWYQTFKRQDDCKQFYYPSYTNYPKVTLPYEYPFSVIKQIKTAAMSAKCKRKRRKKQKRITKLIVDDRPRKSPRCHASTLAIMSSLGKRRPRDSPDKRTELPSCEPTLVSNEMIVDEESRCSTIIDPPPLTPSEAQISQRTPAQTVPEIKIDNKLLLAAETKKEEEEIKKAEEKIDQLFTEMCFENNDDVIAHFVQCIKKEVDLSPSKDGLKKGKGKGKSSLKRESSTNVEENLVCLPVDPEIFEEELMVECSVTPGPIADVLSLIDGYRTCSSMERADYEHMNPHAVDALRVLIADSCNSSDCGGSSACDYSFLEDGRVCKKRKKKKRNMTGWPANKRKFMKKGEELSTVVLRRNCRARDGMSAGPDPVKETQTPQPQSDKALDSEVVVKLKEEPNSTENLNNSVDSDVKTDSCKPDGKPCSVISRTTSLDSTSIKSFDHVQSCYIRVNKMPDGCIETLSRRLRSSDSSPQSPSKRGSSRKAKTVGRASLRRCR